MARIKSGDQMLYYFFVNAFKFPGPDDVYFSCSVDISTTANFPVSSVRSPWKWLEYSFLFAKFFIFIVIVLAIRILGNMFKRNSKWNKNKEDCEQQRHKTNRNFWYHSSRNVQWRWKYGSEQTTAKYCETSSIWWFSILLNFQNMFSRPTQKKKIDN